jgi:hypothetical protein
VSKFASKFNLYRYAEVAILLFGGALSVDHAASTVSVATGLTNVSNGAGGGAGGAGKLKFRAAPETGVLFKLLRWGCTS